jgi:hypothetical protein
VISSLSAVDPAVQVSACVLREEIENDDERKKGEGKTPDHTARGLHRHLLLSPAIAVRSTLLQSLEPSICLANASKTLLG